MRFAAAKCAGTGVCGRHGRCRGQTGKYVPCSRLSAASGRYYSPAVRGRPQVGPARLLRMASRNGIGFPQRRAKRAPTIALPLSRTATTPAGLQAGLNAPT